jgi:hypothetical protein
MLQLLFFSPQTSHYYFKQYSKQTDLSNSKMHVKRHFNRLFGSFRNSSSIGNSNRKIAAVGGPSQWELVDHETSKETEDISKKGI